jgi:hypothetical protein
VRPESPLIEELTSTWLEDHFAKPTPRASAAISAPADLLPTERHAALAARYRDPASFQRLSDMKNNLTFADLALLQGDRVNAVQAYRNRIRSGGDLDAWVGFIVARYAKESGIPATSPLERPEVIVALYARIQELGTAIPEPDELVTWLDARADEWNY